MLKSLKEVTIPGQLQFLKITLSEGNRSLHTRDGKVSSGKKREKINVKQKSLAETDERGERGFSISIRDSTGTWGKSHNRKTQKLCQK